jgi:hypothetical protein
MGYNRILIDLHSVIIVVLLNHLCSNLNIFFFITHIFIMHLIIGGSPIEDEILNGKDTKN